MHTITPGAVVVGVDGSSPSDAAIEWAVDLAQTQHRPLVLVCGAGEPTASERVRDGRGARQALRMEARRLTDRALGRVRKIDRELEVTARTPLRPPADALLELADEASILVVGTRGRGRVKSMVLGSVSAAVCARAGCPVAVIRPTSAAEQEIPGPVVVGIDASVQSAPALDFAFEIASAQGAVLEVVHNWAPTHSWGHHGAEEQFAEGEAQQRALEIALAGYEETFPDVEVHRHLPRSSPVDTLRVLSETASLIVVGARPDPGPTAVVGSVSRAVVEHARCPVVVVRSAPAASPLAHR